MTPTETHHFPTHPAYLVPVEIKEIPQYGEGQKGVFAAERIAKGTRMWVWTDRVTSIHHNELKAYIQEHFGDDSDDDDAARKKIKEFLRQGFVLPPSSSSETMSRPVAKEKADDFFHSNPTDAGRLTNHSANPNTGPDGALRDILPGEEITMDYAFHGNPAWYQEICARYKEVTEAQIAAQDH